MVGRVYPVVQFRETRYFPVEQFVRVVFVCVRELSVMCGHKGGEAHILVILHTTFMTFENFAHCCKK
jgi:hypothetical protein